MELSHQDVIILEILNCLIEQTIRLKLIIDIDNHLMTFEVEVVVPS